MTLISYPSIDQAGGLTIAAGGEARKNGPDLAAHVDSLSARFKGKSVFVAVLPQQNNWYYEAVNKKYSASGQYPITWQPPYPGVWRMAGRVKGKFYVTDIPSDRFIFGCSQSGTLDCLFAYLESSSASGAAAVATPAAIEREISERWKGSDAAAELDDSGSDHVLMTRKTRYRDVCNSVDDMKEIWRNNPETLRSDPGHNAELLKDCAAIIERLDSRLKEYAKLTEHLAAALPKMKEQQNEPGLQSFAAAVASSNGQLKGIKLVTATRALSTIDKINQKLEQLNGAQPNVRELDRMAESVRDVANHQEVQLKKLRAATMQLADACTKRREKASPAVLAYVTQVGRECRKVLRNRDTEE
jgi:hypothetical protein